jgi:LPS-assembly lipoprotein
MSSSRAAVGLLRRRALAGAVMLLLLVNCGFQPLYGNRAGPTPGNTVSDMSYIAVDIIPERAGHLVRNQLLDRLHPRGMAARPVYRLKVRLNTSREGIAFQQDDSATRFNLRLSADFELTDTRAGSVVLKGHTLAISAFNVVRSDYANLISERDAVGRAARSLADGIQSRIAVYFSRLRG